MEIETIGEMDVFVQELDIVTEESEVKRKVT